MEITTIIFVVAMVLGIVSSRVTLVGARGGVMSDGIWRAGLGAALTVVVFSLFVWGFSSLSWYWPIIAFAIGTVICAIVVTLPSWPALYAIQPALDAVVIGLGGSVKLMRTRQRSARSGLRQAAS